MRVAGTWVVAEEDESELFERNTLVVRLHGKRMLVDRPRCRDVVAQFLRALEHLRGAANNRRAVLVEVGEVRRRLERVDHPRRCAWMVVPKPMVDGRANLASV